MIWAKSTYLNLSFFTEQMVSVMVTLSKMNNKLDYEYVLNAVSGTKICSIKDSYQSDSLNFQKVGF